MYISLRRIRPSIFLAAFLALGSAANAWASRQPIQYLLDLREPASHLVKVTMSVAGTKAGTEFQFPTWSNLYQIRDFVRDVQDVEAQCTGKSSPLKRLDMDTWKSLSACSNLKLHYSVYANQDNVFSSVLNNHRAFLSFATLLFYLPRERSRAVRVRFALPEGWKLATTLDGSGKPGEYQARNYDRLADSPAEAGIFEEYQYTQKGATYRVVVDAPSDLYSAKHLLNVLLRITATETALMQDVPFRRYTFFYYFPEKGVGGGMEHRNGTAISIPADQMRDSLYPLESTSAHEFFHLWNVKRIRPQGLEPIDYIHGNDTSDLWFSEGLTCTYAELVLLRAGLISRREFYDEIANQVAQLKARPARHFQSAEEAGREAWLEKYPDYFRPERSISYYNKGELLGYLLDLAIRHASGNRYSLDSLMRRLNVDFAQRGRCFDDADLMRLIGELAPGFNCRAFFRECVDGTRDLNYDTYLGYAGLHLEIRSQKVAELGFKSLKSFIGPVVVESVEPQSSAQEAGLKPGDVLLKMDGYELTWLPDQAVGELGPGQRVKFLVERNGRVLKIEYRTGSKPGSVYSIEGNKHITPAERLVREGWLGGKTSEGQTGQN